MATKNNKTENKDVSKSKVPKGTEVPESLFEVDGKKFKFTVGKYIIPGVGAILAKDALKNSSELERLVEVKSGIIKPA